MSKPSATDYLVAGVASIGIACGLLISLFSPPPIVTIPLAVTLIAIGIWRIITAARLWASETDEAQS